MTTRFSDALAGESFDVVVVGSGAGGLATGAVLARAGRRVLVLERHYEAGGFLHTFSRKGFVWDVGLHYIGMVHRAGTQERQLYDYLTEGRVAWAEMGSPYDRAIIDDEVYDFLPHPREQAGLWKAKFPGEHGAIDAYLKLVRDAQRRCRAFFAERAMPAWVSKVAGGWMRRGFLDLAGRTTYSVLRELTDNERLIAVWCAQCGDYGLPPGRSSFGIHAMVVQHYRHGGAYPVGGSRVLHEAMAETIESRGGLVAVKAPVERILVSGGRAVGVRMDSGVEVRAPVVVSTVGAANTVNKLLRGQEAVPGPWRQDLREVGASMGHLCLYLGLDASDEALGLPKYNYWIYDTPGVPVSERLTDAYLSFPSAKDPAWPTEHPGTATVQCIGPARHADFAPWAGRKWRQRGEDYEEMKAAFAESMLERLYELHPSVRDHVAYQEVSSPLSTVHFSDYDQGEIYGLDHTPARFALPWLRPRTPIRGLFLAGQDVLSCGVTGALFSGVLAGSAVLGLNAYKVVLGGRG